MKHKKFKLNRAHLLHSPRRMDRDFAEHLEEILEKADIQYAQCDEHTNEWIYICKKQPEDALASGILWEEVKR